MLAAGELRPPSAAVPLNLRYGTARGSTYKGAATGTAGGVTLLWRHPPIRRPAGEHLHRGRYRHRRWATLVLCGAAGTNGPPLTTRYGTPARFVTVAPPLPRSQPDSLPERGCHPCTFRDRSFSGAHTGQRRNWLRALLYYFPGFQAGRSARRPHILPESAHGRWDAPPGAPDQRVLAVCRT